VHDSLKEALLTEIARLRKMAKKYRLEIGSPRLRDFRAIFFFPIFFFFKNLSKIRGKLMLKATSFFLCR
jgi:hypothetical protein